MEELKRLQSRLVAEEADLASTLQEIEAAERQADEMRARADRLRKRIALLRQYIVMIEDDGGSAAEVPPLEPEEPEEAEVESPQSGPERRRRAPASKSGGSKRERPPARARTKRRSETSSPEPQPQPSAPEPQQSAPEPEPENEPAPPEPQPISPSPDAIAAAAPGDSASSADADQEIDDERFATEILSRVHAFEDVALLLMDHLGKPLRPGDFGREFRRLEHSPDFVVTEESITFEMDQRPALFERQPGGGFVLTEEGVAEARRLLARLL